MNKVAVIGAGVMGSGIAAQIANAGVGVRLLDRPGLAAAALQRMAKATPSPFMSQRAARLVEVGDSDADLADLADCDWIIEAVVERLEVKQALYRRIDAARRPDAAVSSNTSTIPLARLVEGQSAAFARAFLITHFFNPPRTLRLLELVSGPASEPRTVERVRAFCDVSLGKTPVVCHDSPGFIANRLGTYWLQLAVNAALDLGLSVEAADAAMGKPLGLPKTGVFGLLDLVGLDLMPQIVGSLRDALPGTDAFHDTLRDWPLLTRLIESGHTGRKGGGGFYRLDRSGGATTKQVLDLESGDYRAERPAEIPGRDASALLAAPGRVGDYVRRVLVGTLAYAASLVPEVADDIVAVDAAMRLGYNWQRGPFEMIDAIGAAAFADQVQASGLKLPKLLAMRQPFYLRLDGRRHDGRRHDGRRHDGQRQSLGLDGAYRAIARRPGVLLLDDAKAAGQPLLKNGSAALWDLGDGVACFEMTSKMGSFDVPIMDLLVQAVALVEQRFKALVIGHDGDNFSAGANLTTALFAANIAAWDEIETLLTAGQTAFKALKYAPFPVVAAPFGLALGGGCEIVLHADAVQAHAETRIGLVECGVGLIPGWGGCGEMLDRWWTHGGLPNGPMPAVTKVFEQVGAATTSGSAAEAKELLYLRPADGITMNRDRLLADAKARALSMVDGYVPPSPPSFALPGPAGKAALLIAAHGAQARGVASEHDVTVATALATVLSGGPADPLDCVSEAALLALERAAFMALMRHPATLARIEHTLATGKPLRN